MEMELVGPRVSVDRNGTADRGGGQFVIKDGKLLVRARNIERLLGASIAIDHIQLVDLARLRAKVRFVDGQTWNVESEQGEDLTAFFKQVESVAGRADLVREPPRIMDLVRAAATPARVRTVLFTALALMAFVPLRWLGSSSSAVGIAIAMLGVAVVLVGAIAAVPGDGALRARLRPWLSWPAFAAALAAILAGSLGSSDASARASADRALARADAQAKERADAIAAQAQRDAADRRAHADALGAQLQDAMQGERFRDAKLLRDQLLALAPEHPVAAQVRQALERALAELDERERVAGITRGIAQARVIVKDPIACETAKRVADANALLKRAAPDDGDYEAARHALSDLERCRKRVRARFAQSAEDGRHRMRMLAAAQTEAAVRRLGIPASVKLVGHKSDVLRIESRELDAGAAARILALSGGADGTFEAARTSEGFMRIELRGDKFERDVELQPVSAETLVVPVLEKFGLAKSLTPS